MLTRDFRLAMKRPEGQALVVACLMVLVLSLAVLTTATLGHTVHERVRLQNNADAAAFSMAAMEARAFNFYAFANRAQVSHYVSAMVWQSLDSFIYFTEAFLTDAFAMAKTVTPCSGKGVNPVCLFLASIPGVGEVLHALKGMLQVLETFLRIFQESLRNLDVDKWIGRVMVPGHRVLNGVLAAGSTAVMEATLSHVESTSQHILHANDPNLDPTLSALATGPLNACLFDRAHFREANGSPLAPNTQPWTALAPERTEESSKVSRAKRVMGAVSNATRHACDADSGHCRSNFVTSRQDLSLLRVPVALDLVKSVFDVKKLGQTRMLTFNAYKKDESKAGTAAKADEDVGTNQIRWWFNSKDSPTGALAEGDVLGSDDLYAMGFFGLQNLVGCGPKGDWKDCHGDPRRKDHTYMFETSIWAMSDEDAQKAGLEPGGVHWRLAYPGDAPSSGDGELGLNVRHFGTVPIYTANVRPVSDGNHRWEGVVPFSHFEPGQFQEACANLEERGSDPSLSIAALRSDERGEEFNQPSAWVFLNKSPARMRNPLADPTATRPGPSLLNQDGVLHVRWADGTTLVLDDTRRALLGFAQGINAISRAQTYYHRPGTWAEHPNFFNPYWRPRLASVHQGRGAFPLMGDLLDALPDSLRDISQKVVTH